MADEELDGGEFWQAYREAKKQKKLWHQENTVPKERELLAKLPYTKVVRIDDDGSGGEKWVLRIETNRGQRIVDWWLSTGRWKVRQGRGEGVGLYNMGRYFKLIEKGKKL